MSDVDVIQQGLEQALERAAQADDRELAGRVREDGRRLMFMFNGLVRMSQIHDVGNEAFEKPARECASIVDGLIELLGAVHLVFVEDQVYVNDIRLRIRNPEQQAIEVLIGDLSRHDIGGISIHQHLGPDAIKALAIAVAGDAAEGSPRGAILEGLGRPDALELAGQYRFRVGGEPTHQQKDISAAIERGAAVLHEAVVNLAANRLPNPLPVRRAVIDLVEGLRADPDSMAASAVRLRKGPVGERHLLGVCNLAVTLGERLGLSEAALSDLGVAAMLHDIGYGTRPDKVGHSAAGLRMLIKQRGFHEAKVRRLLSVFEHHLPHEPLPGGRRPILFARILRIVDDFDVMSSKRPGQPLPPSPATVLGRMWACRGREYDPAILTVFVQIMGRYPPGTLIELSDGRWVLSVCGARDQQRFAYPRVRVVQGADGEALDGHEEIDLYEVRDTVRASWVLDPSAEHIDPDASLDRVFQEEAAV